MNATLKGHIKQRAPRHALSAYRDLVTWSSMLRSPNKQFLRFAAPGHYYSPIPDLESVRKNAERTRTADGLAGIELNEQAQLDLLRTFGQLHDEMPFPESPTAGFRYHLDNEWFSYGDCVALYSVMRTFRPSRIIEVGSGFSSAAMLDLGDLFFDNRLELTFIEPYPERLRSLFRGSDDSRCTVVASPLQEVDVSLFSSLEENDILFIDSTHVAKTDSDVLYLLFQVLPALKNGVLVHFHDMPWPFEYPAMWLEAGRAWNEAYFLRAFLMYNPLFAIAYYGPYLAAHHPEELSQALPTAIRPASKPTTLANSSIWLRKSDRTQPTISGTGGPIRQ